MQYYSHHIGDYRKDTAHLSLTEHGAYRQLLDTYYTTERPLTLDYAILMRTHCARSADDMQAIKNVLQDFFIITDEGWIHKRCDIEIDAYHAKSAKAVESAKARWERVREERNANAMRTHSEGNANHKPITKNHKPIKIKNNSSAGAVIFPPEIPEQLQKDFIALRKSKKAALTKTAIEGIQRESVKAGISLQTALEMCCQRGWAGFKAEWVKDPPPPQYQNARTKLDEERKRTYENLTGTGSTEQDITGEYSTVTVG